MLEVIKLRIGVRTCDAFAKAIGFNALSEQRIEVVLAA